MPRVSYPSNAKFRAGQHDDPENENMDFCRDCFRQQRHIDVIPPELIESEWLDLECDHPDYAGDDYECIACKKTLTSEDN